MNIMDALCQVEVLLDGVSVEREENWRKMVAAKQLLRETRKSLEKISAERKKEDAENADDKDPVCR